MLRSSLQGTPERRRRPIPSHLLEVLHSPVRRSARKIFPVLRARPISCGTCDSPVTLGWSRRFGCGHGARWDWRFRLSIPKTWRWNTAETYLIFTQTPHLCSRSARSFTSGSVRVLERSYSAGLAPTLETARYRFSKKQTETAKEFEKAVQIYPKRASRSRLLKIIAKPFPWLALHLQKPTLRQRFSAARMQYSMAERGVSVGHQGAGIQGSVVNRA